MNAYIEESGHGAHHLLLGTKRQQISYLLRSGLSLHQTLHHTSLVVWSRHRPLTEPAQFGELHASPEYDPVGHLTVS